MGPDKCCVSYFYGRIPLSKVVSYQTTVSACLTIGIIFITNTGKEICTDPKERWVQRLRKLVDARNLKHTSEDFIMPWQNSWSEPKPETKREPEPMPKLEPEPKLEPKTEPRLEPEPESEPMLEPEPKQEPKTKSEMQPKPELETESQLKPELEPVSTVGTTQGQRSKEVINFKTLHKLDLETMSTTGTTKLRKPEGPDHEKSLWSTHFCQSPGRE